MSSYRNEAKAAAAGKMRRMGLGEGSRTPSSGQDEKYASDTGPLVDMTKKVGPNEKDKRAYKRGGAVEGDEPKVRMDRPCRARGGRVAKGKATTVNVIIPQGGAGATGGAPPAAAMPMMPPPGAGGPPPGMPPGGMPPRPMMPPPGGPGAMSAPAGLTPPMIGGRKRGGRVTADMDAGAGGGLGRLEKTMKYGAKA